MRITSVSACGLLTFEDFGIDLDKRLTLIVGPNGTGKSNFGCLFEIVACVIQAADRDSPDLRQALKRYLASSRSELDNHGIEIRLSFQLTEIYERELFVSFVRACAVAALLGNNYGFDTIGIEHWAEGIVEDQLKSLFEGEIIVHHGGTPDAQWECGIEFESSGVRYFWEMLGSRPDSLVQTKDRLRRDLRGMSLSDRLSTGSPPPPPFAPTPPAQPFRFSTLLPDANSSISCSLDLGRQPPPRAFREFADQIGVSPIGLPADRISHYGLAHLFSMILRRSIVQTNDTRLLPRWSSRSESLEIESGESILKALLTLKNGRSTENQAFRNVQSLFSDFTHGRKMDLAFLPASEERGDTTADATLSILPIAFVSVNALRANESERPHQQVPIEFAGAGAWEALILAFVLGSRKSSLIVLDEPAVALHPNLQRKLMTHLQALDTQVVVITHSPYLFPLDEDQSETQVVRFERGEHAETLAAVVSDSLVAKIVPKLRQTGNERIAFASGVVLTEGKFDQVGIRTLVDQAKLDLDGYNIAIIDCDGRENIPDYARFCAGLGLRYLAIQDGDASKPDAAQGVQAVRDAVGESSLGALFEFPENIETTLGGVKKDSRAISDAARKFASQLELSSEIADLHQKLSDLVRSVSHADSEFD